MENKFIALAVGLTVGVIMLSGFLWPIVSDATATETTYKNDGFFRMSEITSESETTTMTWDYTAPYVFNINGESLTIPNGTTGGNPVYPYTIFATDGWGLRVAVSANNRVDLNLYASGENTSLIWYASTVDSDSVTITLDAGVATFAKSGSTVTRDYTSAFIPDNKGDYVLKKPTDAAYLNGDSKIYSTGRSSLAFGSNTFALNLNLNGSIDDEVDTTIIAPIGFTVSNIVVDYEEVEGHIDLYRFDKVTFDITQDSTSITTGAVYSQVIIPYEVTAEKSEHLDTTQIALVAAIGTLGAIVLIAVAAGSIRRLD